MQSIPENALSAIPLAVCLTLISLSACGGSTDTTDLPDDAMNSNSTVNIDPGDRPARIASSLPDGDLKNALLQCDATTMMAQPFSIGHRGAPLGYPEHTRESYLAAAVQGAGAIECDVTFTKDESLVCRHSQCDLHTTTNILDTAIAQRCSIPPDYNNEQPFAAVKCCTSDITLAEFSSLEGRHDSVNRNASTLEEYYATAMNRTVAGGPDRGSLMTHAQSITLFDELGVAMVPELKATLSANGADTFPSRATLADKLIAEYETAGVNPLSISIQSFDQQDLLYLAGAAPAYAPNLIWLDGRYTETSFNPLDESSWQPSMQSLVDSGIQTLAPPIWMLLTLNDNGEIVPSPYALAARNAGLQLVTWTLERSGTLQDGGGFYYQSISDVIDDESDMYRVLDVLAQDVGVKAVFSDWPATTSWYAHCRAN